MRIVDARAMPISHEDLIAVTESSVYYRQKRGETAFSIYRYDEEDGAVAEINQRTYEDYGMAKLFMSDGRVYFLNEAPDRTGVVRTELVSLEYRTGREDVLATFEKRGNSTLYWVLGDRYFLFLTSYGTTDEAWLLDVETNQGVAVRRRDESTGTDPRRTSHRSGRPVPRAVFVYGFVRRRPLHHLQRPTRRV
ncbi:hypothetical protein [Exiguobacterium alkaliphilum]|uniref:Peptidase S9A N-terminal domain-containing protein n=1 Tax=Exiguobacterium alkaliphilum TaxID=1428684 RepID=A0ABT2KVL2_9BACL|nr:hypothetical protein [Exiguobacterium alkaliphilum]MCT4794989.1 hypothetical protein [Exiguobacterium alkaliphilum]